MSLDRVVFRSSTGLLVVWYEESRLSLSRFVYQASCHFAVTNFAQVYWSEGGELVAIACEDTFYVLRFSREAYVEAVQSGQVEEDGVEAAFEVITDISET